MGIREFARFASKIARKIIILICNTNANTNTSHNTDDIAIKLIYEATNASLGLLEETHIVT